MRQRGFGVNDNVNPQVDKTHAAIRTSLRPPEKGVYGSYSLRFASGAFAAGALAAAVVFAFRWATPGVSCLLRRLWGAVEVTTAFAQGGITLDAIRGSSATAQYTGGAVISVTGKAGARSSRMAPTLQQVANTATGVIAIANTAALAAPTPAWALDTQPFASLEGTLTTGVAGIMFDTRAFDEPQEFQNAEGFLVRATQPATGVVNPFVVVVEWDEIDPARYYGNF